MLVWLYRRRETRIAKRINRPHIEPTLGDDVTFISVKNTNLSEDR